MLIRGKILLLLIGFGVLPLLVFSLVFIRNAERSIKDQVLTDLSLSSKLTEDHIENFFETHKSRVVGWASDGYIKQETRKIVDEIQAGKVSNRAEFLGNYIKKWKLSVDDSVLKTDIYTTEGLRLISAFEETEFTEHEKDYEKDSDLEYASEINSSASLPVGNAVIGELEGKKPDVLEFHVSTPIVDLETGETIAVMLNHVLMSELNNHLASVHDIYLGAGSDVRNTLEIYLVDYEKRMLTPSRFMKDAVLKQKVDTVAVNSCIETGINVKDIYKDYRDVEVFGASRCTEGRWWIILLEVDSEEIMSSVNELRRGLLITLLSVVVLLLLTAVLLTKRIRRVVRDEVSLIRKIASGELEVRLPVKGKGELAQINNDVNAMAQSLITSLNKARSLQEEAEKHKGALREKINELEKFTKLTTGRELKMMELKEEVEKLQKKKDGKDKS